MNITASAARNLRRAFMNIITSAARKFEAGVHEHHRFGYAD